jgi:hypothetical protein
MGARRDRDSSSSPNGEETRRFFGRWPRSAVIEQGNRPGGCIRQGPDQRIRLVGTRWSCAGPEPPPPSKRWSARLVRRARAADQRFRVWAKVEDRGFSGLFLGTCSASGGRAHACGRGARGQRPAGSCASAAGSRCCIGHALCSTMQLHYSGRPAQSMRLVSPVGSSPQRSSWPCARHAPGPLPRRPQHRGARARLQPQILPSLETHGEVRCGRHLALTLRQGCRMDPCRANRRNLCPGRAPLNWRSTQLPSRSPSAVRRRSPASTWRSLRVRSRRSSARTGLGRRRRFASCQPF